jgi:hypothetical protein
MPKIPKFDSRASSYDARRDTDPSSAPERFSQIALVRETGWKCQSLMIRRMPELRFYRRPRGLVVLSAKFYGAI